MNFEELYLKLKKDAESSGYNLNPDAEFAKDLAKGLLANEARYGYQACPCRLASGKKNEDLDIICPCDYRDTDLEEYDACYCALYVSNKISSGKKQAAPIPERRPAPDKRKFSVQAPAPAVNSLPLPVWRCKVCGYLCAREDSPGVCPICKAGKERFERFI
jgi:ferredoxin-thioredoxin reductase catalytic subunit/rubredoxin